MISAEMPYQKQFAEVHGKRIAYIDEGTGEPIVLLHGNPTSSYLWRNVVPELVDSGRVIVPDLIGQGDSEKLPASEGPDRYSFQVAYDYLSGLLDVLGLDGNITLVIHDWGSGLGFHYTKNNPGKVRGVAYMEAVVMPLNWDDWPESARGIFQGFRSEKGEDLVLNRNMFIEGVLPSAVLRELTEEEMAHYRSWATEPNDRQPTLNWPRQIPIEGEPAHMVELVQAYGEFMAASDIPKLFINAEPGSILVGRQREFCRSWANQQEVTVKGSHFVQEDSPAEIGQAVANWLKTIKTQIYRSNTSMSQAPAFMVANFQINDAEEYRKYEKGFFPILKKHGGSFFTYDDNTEHLEGQSPRKGRMVIFQFPSEEAAKNWWNDPDYQALSEFRRAGTTMESLTLVHGLPPRD